MSRPNILFLFSDEHSFRFMGHTPVSEGGEADVETPTFDELAAKGTVFTNAYCQMPLCTPSRISLLCGKEVRKSGAWSNNSVLRPELDTIPRSLAAVGYETCLVGKMHLGGNQQFVGFQHRPYGDLTGHCGHQWEPVPEAARGMRERTSAAVGVTTIPESRMQEQVIARESLAWLREHRHAKPDTPWFLCASLSRPHFPLTAPKRWIDRYPVDKISEPMIPATGDAYDHPMSVGMRKGFRTEEIDHDECMRARSGYFACVSYLDEMIGDMLNNLEAAGLLDNTIVVYTTDHGELAGEHGMWWKNGWYEGCTRVPFIVSTPEQRRGEAPANRYDTPVALIDLFPSLCALAEAPLPEDLDGIDLSNAIRGGGEPSARPVYTDALSPRWGEGTEFRSIRLGNYKYVRFRDFEPLFFDLKNDPAEQINLLKQGVPEEAKETLAKLEQFAAESIDFDEAERERVERDGDLHKQYPGLPNGKSQNQFIMPDGRVVEADDSLYTPDVVAERAEDLFGDFPG